MWVKLATCSQVLCMGCSSKTHSSTRHDRKGERVRGVKMYISLASLFTYCLRQPCFYLAVSEISLVISAELCSSRACFGLRGTVSVVLILLLMTDTHEKYKKLRYFIKLQWLRSCEIKLRPSSGMNIKGYD